MSDRSACRPRDRVNQQYRAERLNHLWVSDFTYVSTWQGWLYVAFVLDALRQVLYARQPAGADGLAHNSDREAQYVSI